VDVSWPSVMKRSCSMPQIRASASALVTHSSSLAPRAAPRFGSSESLCSAGLVHLSDSLSNPGTLLLRLVAALDECDELKKTQVSAVARNAIMAQTGAVDPTMVRLEVRENRKLSPAEVAELVARYHAGASIRSLSQAFGMHEQTVRAHLRRESVSLRPLRALAEAQETQVARLYVEERWTLAEAAAKFEVSASAVRNVLMRRGVERRAQARRARTE